MTQGNKISASAEAGVRKILINCAEDEIALDSLAQWASNPVGKNASYGIEENLPVIMLNLSRRFNVSSSIASEYASRLREYGMQFMLYSADISYFREKILEELRSDVSKKWQDKIAKRIAKSSNDTKRVAYLLWFLINHGYEPKIFENILDEVQAFHCAVFEKPFDVNERREELIDVGILNRLLYTNEDLSKQYVHTINQAFSSIPLELDPETLKIQLDTKKMVSRMFDKKMFDQLRILDETIHENLGIKQFSGPLEKFALEKKITGVYKNRLAVSPFLLDDTRDEVRLLKERRLDDYETRVESSILKLISESWPNAKLEFSRLGGEQRLWRIDNDTNPKLYVYLTLWATESNSSYILSKIDLPRTSSLIAIVLNQSFEAAKSNLGKLGELGELSLICSLNQKEVYTETIVGSPTPYSNKFVERLSKALNLSSQISAPSKNALAQTEVGVTGQFGIRSERIKVLLGSQSTREILWVPMRERNSNMGIFGDTETGKTQTIKRILVELRKSNTPFLVLDTVGEYLPNGALNSEFGTSFDGNAILINPLELDKGNSPREQMYGVLEALSAVYGFKDEERAFLRSAINKCYEKCGIFEDNKSTWSKPPPTLKELREALDLATQAGDGREKNYAKEVLQKLGGVLENPLFSRAKTNIPFEKLVTGPIVLDLHGLKDESLKTLAIDFFMGKIPYFTEKNSEDLRLCVVIDGLQKLLWQNSSALRLLREARQRGIGVIYSCHDPVNLPELALNSTATITCFRMSDSKNTKSLGEYLGIRDHQVLNKGLSAKFSAVAKFSSENTPIKFDSLPYSQKREIISPAV